jgi:hypothetical protein
MGFRDHFSVPMLHERSEGRSGLSLVDGDALGVLSSWRGAVF